MSLVIDDPDALSAIMSLAARWSVPPEKAVARAVIERAAQSPFEALRGSAEPSPFEALRGAPAPVTQAPPPALAPPREAPSALPDLQAWASRKPT